MSAAIAQAFICAAQGATIDVTTTQDVVAGDGLCSLREAVDNANAEDLGDMHADCAAGDPGPANGPFGGEDRIRLRTPDSPISLTLGELEINSNVSIEGPLGSPPTRTISGQLQSRIFNITEKRRVTLENLVLIRGLADRGGALRVGATDAPIFVNNCDFRTNTATVGGGAIAQVGTLTLTNSTISGNSAPRGGGIAQMSGTSAPQNTAVLNFSNVTVTGNEAEDGGGLYLDDVVDIDRSVITENSASDDGGGVFVAPFSDADVEIRISDVSANTSVGAGGGIWSGATFCSRTARCATTWRRLVAAYASAASTKPPLC